MHYVSLANQRYYVSDSHFVKDLNINSYKNIDELLEKVDFEGKDVCVLPYGGSVVPLLQD
ncbi:MAG: hypothetical protein ACLR6T_02390 [Intestinibacter sp.]